MPRSPMPSLSTAATTATSHLVLLPIWLLLPHSPPRLLLSAISNQATLGILWDILSVATFSSLDFCHKIPKAFPPPDLGNLVITRFGFFDHSVQFSYSNRIGACSRPYGPISDREPKCPRQRIFFCLLYPFDLLFPFPRHLFFCGLVPSLAFSVRLRVPVKIAVLLPTADWCHERVSEIIFSMLGCRDIFPAEVDAAARP